jgi:hypothetical protein
MTTATKDMAMAEAFEDKLNVNTPLSIYRGYINQIPPNGIFTIDLGFAFSGALVQLIPLTSGSAPCTITSVVSAPKGDGILEVTYKVSDASQLVQIAYLLFVTV